MSECWRVLLIEDQPPMAQAVRGAVMREPQLHWVGDLPSRVDLPAVLLDEKPDLVLVDLELPVPVEDLPLAQQDVPSVEEGLQAIAEVKQYCPTAKPVAFSSLVYHAPHLARRALAAGAAVLHKSGEPGIDWEYWLVGALLAIARNEWRIPPALRQVLSEENAAPSNDGPPRLPKRIAEALAWYGQGLRDWQIAEKMHLADETSVRRYLADAKRHLKVPTREAALQKAARLGLLPRLPQE